MKKIEIFIYNCNECPYYNNNFNGYLGLIGCDEIPREFNEDEELDTIPDDCPLEDI